VTRVVNTSDGKQVEVWKVTVQVGSPFNVPYVLDFYHAPSREDILNVIEDVRWLSQYCFEAEELEKAMMFLDMVREKVLRGEYEIHKEVLQPYACEAEEGG
jgi:hypothetical protein